jgi:peptide/nickel transport system substrate-binding protein
MSNLAMASRPVVFAISSAPSDLSPFFSTDGNSQNINRLVHLTLTDFNKDMSFECRLCTSYSEKMEEGKHLLRFKLRKDVKFWDGTTVTAKDVRKTWLYFAKDKKIKSIFRFAFANIEDVIIHNDYDVELVYKKFSLENLSNLNLFKIIKLENLDKDGFVKKKPEYHEIIGAGPYRFGKVGALEVNLKSLQGKSDFIFKVVKDETTLALKIINKEVDLSLSNISPRKYLWLKKNSKKGLNFWELPSTNYNYMGINHRKEGLNDRRVRKALSLLVPRKDLMNYKFKGTVKLSSSLFSSAFKDLYLGEATEKYDPEQAIKLLNEAGYVKGKSGYLEKNGKIFSIDWKASSNKAIVEIVETMKTYYEKVGIKVELTVQEWGTFMRGVKSGSFDIIVGRWIGFTGPDMLKYIFHSASVPPKGANRGHFINKEFDKYIDLATTELDEKKRNIYYKEALKIANKEYSYINLWHPNIVWVGRSCIKNLSLQPNGSFLPLLSIESQCE